VTRAGVADGRCDDKFNMAIAQTAGDQLFKKAVDTKTTDAMRARQRCTAGGVVLRTLKVGARFACSHDLDCVIMAGDQVSFSPNAYHLRACHLRACSPSRVPPRHACRAAMCASPLRVPLHHACRTAARAANTRVG
jgi:hypothetical protein